MENQREHFASRIGFIFMTAGCAIGLGNVWRFPFIAGKYGGGFFVLLYLVCLALFGLPVLLMELSLGRAAQSTYPGAFRKLANPQSRFKWQNPAYFLFGGNLGKSCFDGFVSAVCDGFGFLQCHGYHLLYTWYTFILDKTRNTMYALYTFEVGVII